MVWFLRLKEVFGWVGRLFEESWIGEKESVNFGCCSNSNVNEGCKMESSKSVEEENHILSWFFYGKCSNEVMELWRRPLKGIHKRKLSISLDLGNFVKKKTQKFKIFEPKGVFKSWDNQMEDNSDRLEDLNPKKRL